MKQYMMQFRDGNISIGRINVNLRNCPFCDTEPAIDGMKIFCPICGAQSLADDPLLSFGGLGNGLLDLRFYVNVWNGFLRYDGNHRPIPDLYHRFMCINEGF